jgi:hypothetical protein
VVEIYGVLPEAGAVMLTALTALATTRQCQA